MDLPHRRTPNLPWSCPTPEYPTHRRTAPPRNTILTVDLPHLGTPYSSWTFPTAEHPNHCGPAPQQKTLLSVDLPHSGTPYSLAQGKIRLRTPHCPHCQQYVFYGKAQLIRTVCNWGAVVSVSGRSIPQF